MADKVKLTVNGREIEANKGDVVIKAADDAGVHIPRFCYHPCLKPAGLCRMCLVEVEGVPKLLASCTTPVAEGMKVLTESEKTKWGRSMVLEFYLVNHPLDCPICDKAGECDLQNYTFDHGPQHDDFRDGAKRRYKLEDLGPKLARDMDRCVHCLRCVRFCEEIVGTDELGVFNRGGKTDISIFGSHVVNEYALNIAELCPVGALVTKDFYYKSRVWHHKNVETLCTSCATGCNIYMGVKEHVQHRIEPGVVVKEDRVERITPRVNKAVNDHWICDYGRLNYKYISSPSRIRRAEIRENGRAEQTTLLNALQRTARILRDADPARLGMILTPDATNEEAHEFKRLVELLKASHVAYGYAKPAEGRVDFLRSRDKYPNSRGVARVTGGSFDGMKIVELCEQGKIDTLVLFHPQSILKAENGQALYDRLARAAGSVGTLIVIDVMSTDISNAATVLFPGRVHAEKAGTIDNVDGVTQKLAIAVQTDSSRMSEKDMFLHLSAQIAEKSPARVG